MGGVAVGWGLFLVIFGWESWILDARAVIGFFVASGGLALLLMQSEQLRTFIDFRLPWLAFKFSLGIVRESSQGHWLALVWRRWLLRMWPASTLIRLWTHFFFTVWWILMGVGVCLSLDAIEDVRLVFYFGWALLHFDRLMRLIQWVRG